MKRGKDEDKVTERPMFPRLSVNDAGKGGPRAPPRNKMALYEQLCTPAQRFSGGRFSAGMNASNSIPPASSKQVSGYGNNLFPPLHVPPSMPITQSERPENHPNRHMNLNSFSQVELEQRRNAGDDDDYTVPTYLRSDTLVHAPNRGSSRSVQSGTRPTYSDHLKQNMSSSTHVNLEHNMPPISNRDDQRNHAQVTSKERIHARSDSVKYDISMESRDMIDRHSNPASGISPQGFRDLLPKGSDRLHSSNDSTRQKFGITLLDKGEPNAANIEEFARDIDHGDVSKQRTVRNGGGHNILHPRLMENEYNGHQFGNPTALENAENCDDMSETSMVDSMSELDITPDDVVSIIGYKHFLKARKAIANQQRVFSVQVFELHRLIQVQRHIAASPQIMIDDNAYVGKALKEPRATKVPQLEYAIKPPVHSVKPKSHSGKPKRDAECTAESADKTDGRNVSQLPNYAPFSGNAPPTPTSSDPRTGPWCFPQPSGHQWLVPVMSPSEGLIYKPYPGPGFMSPTSGGFGPVGTIPDPAAPFAHGGFMNPPYGGFPTPYFPPYNPHPQGVGVLPGPNYFPPFSMPSGNPALSSSAVDQIHHHYPGFGVHRQQPLHSASGASTQQPNQSSCNIPKQSSEAASLARKIRHPKENVLHGSTASSALQRPQPRRGVTLIEKTPTPEPRNSLSLFPPTPSPTDAPPSSPPPLPSQTISEMPKVIKATPHNARSATESAARIFQSIQRERKN